VAVVGPSGRRLGSQVVETNGQALIEQLRTIPRPRHLCFEEGVQSAWLHEILSPHVDELVVTGISAKRNGQKDDQRDAFGLAEALRIGSVETKVFKAPSRYGLQRELARSYTRLTGDIVRTQLRLKTLYRSRGVATPGKHVYNPKGREQWVEKLPVSCRPSAILLGKQLDELRTLHKDIEKQLITESHRHPITRILETCPGLGPIRVAVMVPVIVTPERFRTSRQLWSYSGLGIVMRTSNDWVRDGDRWVRAPVRSTRGSTSASITH
jgi:transposase